MKNLTRPLLLAASLALFSGACITPASAAGMSAEQAIAAAKDASKQASSVGGEWRDTGKMIQKAEALLKEGKTKEAAKMAEAAEIQAMLGYMQATSQSSNNLHI
ncbi:MAG TPA: SoxXA-binding protein [Gammaproteobacteria bacterium]|nr:SoxXA-binding protein [Gammaproteobacteria bacterium]